MLRSDLEECLVAYWRYNPRIHLVGLGKTKRNLKSLVGFEVSTSRIRT
jgi:hypothetical protein